MKPLSSARLYSRSTSLNVPCTGSTAMPSYACDASYSVRHGPSTLITTHSFTGNYSMYGYACAHIRYSVHKYVCTHIQCTQVSMYAHAACTSMHACRVAQYQALIINFMLTYACCSISRDEAHGSTSSSHDRAHDHMCLPLAQLPLRANGDGHLKQHRCHHEDDEAERDDEQNHREAEVGRDAHHRFEQPIGLRGEAIN